MRLIWYVNCLKYLIEYDLMWKLDFIIQIIERMVLLIFLINYSFQFILFILYYVWKNFKIKNIICYNLNFKNYNYKL